MSNTEAKHTPGEWKVRFFRPSDPESDFFVEANNNNMPQLGYGIEILQDDYGDHNGYPREQRLADAKLIAAAPDLLKALKYAVRFLKKEECDVEYIESAIKKATT